VDHSSTAVRYSFAFDQDGAGTTLTVEVEVSRRVPFLDKVEDRIAWRGDRDLDTWLGNFRKALGDRPRRPRADV
jgi:hypothetical protein